VVVLHGASGNLRDWTFGPAQILAERHEVIVFDRPGHGLSGWPAGGERLAVQARLLRGALSALGIERTILVGHSYGGALALAWALDAPETVAGLLLLAAVSHDWDRRIGTLNSGMAIPFAGPAFAQALPALVSNGYIDRRLVQAFAPHPAPAGYFEHLRPDLILSPASLRGNALQLAALKPQIRAMAPRYSALKMPVQLVHCTDDATVPLALHSEPLAAALPQADLTRLSGAGHLPHHTAPAAMAAALARLSHDQANQV
jgi:pimeloyl-ACP methyl ester carboxylesterase